jgi:hypothetical protein
MQAEARGKSRLLIMQAPGEAREARRAACFILQPSGELVRLGQGRGIKLDDICVPAMLTAET